MNMREMGMDQFVWWVGIVESRQDPIKVGRCQVRILGKHTENKSDLPTDSLFWAHPLLPVNDANPYPPKEGEMVIGFFMDSTEGQHPVIFAIIPGIPTMPAKPSEGFYDPRKASELAAAPVKPGESKTNYPRVLNEPTTSRLARNESIEKTIVQQKRADLADAGDWKEPATPYDAVYPYNNVHESESGHINEVDDTPGKERLHNYHRAGTFEEIHPDGTRVSKVVRDNYSIVAGDDYVLVEGTCNIVVNGNAKIRVHGNSTETVDGNKTTKVVGNYEIQGNVDIKGNIKAVEAAVVYVSANMINTGNIEVADW